MPVKPPSAERQTLAIPSSVARCPLPFAFRPKWLEVLPLTSPKSCSSSLHPSVGLPGVFVQLCATSFFSLSFRINQSHGPLFSAEGSPLCLPLAQAKQDEKHALIGAGRRPWASGEMRGSGPSRQRGQGSGRDCPRRALLSPDRPRTRTDAAGQGLDPRRTSLHRPRHLIAQLLLTRRLPTRGVFLLTLCQMWF